jgi:putative acetyltransferase
MLKEKKIIIRMERENDISSVDILLRETFETEDESSLVAALRDKGKFISLVALKDDKVVGHVFFSPAPIKSPKRNYDAITLAPVAVKPEFQNRGIGTSLIQEGLAECERQGHTIVTVLGHPEYYPRFGFTIASRKNIFPPFSAPDEAFMVLEIQEGALKEKWGIVQYPPEFEGL